MRNYYDIVEKAYISVLLKTVYAVAPWNIVLYCRCATYTSEHFFFQTASHISSAFEVLSFTNVQTLSSPCTIPHYPLISTWNITWKIPVHIGRQGLWKGQGTWEHERCQMTPLSRVPNHLG
jgi:hypothetical protein